MEENKGNKISLLSVILVIIMLILLVLVVFMYMQNQNLAKKIVEEEDKTDTNIEEYTQKLEEKDNQIQKLENEISALKNVKKTDIDIAQEALTEALKTSNQTSVNLSKYNTYKVEDVYINGIEIYTEDHLKRKNYPEENIKDILGLGDLVGEVYFTLTFNKSLDGVMAEGSGGEFKGNKLIESKYFIIKKLENGYKVELATGL